MGRSFLNSHRFVTGLSETEICPKCTENKTENIDHFVIGLWAYGPIQLFVRCQVSCFLKNSVGASQWRVCYQWGSERLKTTNYTFTKVENIIK